MSLNHRHTKIWYRTNQLNNAFNDLEKLNTFYDLAQKDATYWKWVVIALHSALYNFMLLALMRTDMSGIWVENIRNKQGRINLFNKKMRLISFLQAFKSIQDEIQMKKYVGSEAFKPTAEIKQSMKLLNTTYRNQLVHYPPMGWSIEVDVIRELILNTIPILGFLISQSGNILLKEDEKIILMKQVKMIQLKVSQNKYE